MAKNFTQEHGLVEKISSKGLLANPAGRQGYEVIILEEVGDRGTRFYASLKPGETLRLSERLLGKFTARAVDIRYARGFPIEGEFSARERGRKVTLRANVRYRVADARVVAMETVDPLGELRDKVISTLNRELARYPESEITPGLIERIISSVGPVPHLGLTVEGAEVIEFIPDQRLTQHVVEEEDLGHQLSVESRKREAEIRWKQEKHSAVDLGDVNTLMHEYPDLIPQVFNTFANRDQQLLQAQMSAVAPAIEAYIQQQREIDAEIDPEEIANIMRRSMSPSRGQLTGPVDGRIDWGDNVIDALPADEPTGESQVEFSKEKESKKKSNEKPAPDDDRIKFG